jgi:hypothetical protein
MSESTFNSNVLAFTGAVPDLNGSPHATDWQTPEQKRMAAYWKHYRCETYDELEHDWNGAPESAQEIAGAVVRGQAVPPGFYAVGEDISLKHRRPDAPYYLARAVVPKFTGLLFSAKRHPQIVCDDQKTEQWLNAFAEQTRLWTHAIRLRNYGGGMGAVGLGFKFVKAVPYIEIHDARFSTPTWVDRTSCTVACLDKREQYSVRVFVKGKPEERWFWTRRLIDEEYDTLWEKVPVSSDGQEPDWDSYKCTRVHHGFGFCPVVWIANDPIDEGTQGDPDCYGIFQLMVKMDALLSQAAKGTLGSCDPTLGIASNAEFDEIKKGSSNALQVEQGGEMEYIEMTGAGIERAQKLVDDLEAKALTIVRCNLDRHAKAAASRSVEEVEYQYASMIERADVFREQYGERGIKLLLEMVLKVARMYDIPRTVELPNGETDVQRRVIKVPKLRVQEGETWRYVERELGEGEVINLKWPSYFTPGLTEITKAVEAAGAAARTYRVVDMRNAVEFLAPYLGIEDVGATLEIVNKDPPLILGGKGLDAVTRDLIQPGPFGK